MHDDELDGVLRVPSPPQRRLSRSSIDLRDLEQQQQQQLQQHDRVVHTDSAPSMIALENFPFKTSKNKLFSKPNFLNKPLECFHSRSNSGSSTATNKTKKKTTESIDAYTIENDNEDLARFIEDNYQFFKKQNGAIDSCGDRGAAASTTVAATVIGNVTVNQKLAQLQACSDPNFLTLKNDIIDGCETCTSKKSKVIKKHKMAASSDSDFVMSFGGDSNGRRRTGAGGGGGGGGGAINGHKSRKFTFKTRIPFTKGSSGSGKHTKTGKYNVLDQQRDDAPPHADSSIVHWLAATDVHRLRDDLIECKQNNATYKGQMHSQLSKSLNGCHRRNNNNETAPAITIHRMLSEGNENASSPLARTHHMHETTSACSDTAIATTTTGGSHPAYDAFDMFVKLFQCEKNNKNICDKQSRKNFNAKIAIHSKDFDNYCDCDNSSVLVNNYNCSSGSCEKLKKTDGSGGGQSSVDGESSILAAGGDSSLMMTAALNDETSNFVFNINGDINMDNNCVLINNLVITSPPVTPKQLLSPKTINQETGHRYLSASMMHLNPNVFSDTSSMSMELIASSASPLEQLVHLRAEPDAQLEHGMCTINNGGGNVVASESNANFIKNDLLAVDDARDRNGNVGVCFDANGGASGGTGGGDNGVGGLGGSTISSDRGTGGSRLRKPSVTYDINVINKSQDFNLDDICPQRCSYAARSGSTSSAST